jgi:hypothetical protein
MKTAKFLLRGLMFEVTHGRDEAGEGRSYAKMSNDVGHLMFRQEEWIRTLNLGPCEIIGFNDMGVVVAWDPAGMGRRVVDWAEAYDMNRSGSIDEEVMAMAN